MRWLVVVFAAWSACAATAQAVRPGALLANGMERVYAAGGKESPAWVVEHVAVGVARGGQAAASRVRVRKEGPAEETWLAEVDGYLLEQRADGTWKKSRPVRSGLALRDGAAEYRCGTVALETIGGVKVPVVHTVVTFFGDGGKAVRRLRERYAVGLATATGGVFEKADAAAPGGWRRAMAFELTRIVRPQRNYRGR